MGTKTKVERKIIRAFGIVIRPANWTMFISGVAIMVSAPVLGAILDWEFVEGFIVWIGGINLAVEGYGNIKDDEDDIKPGGK